MKTSYFPERLLTASLLFSLLAVSPAYAQVIEGTPKPAPVFANLYSPHYPPLARQARIAGDVVIHVEVRPDGSVASAEVVSGNPMLKQAALDSVQKSTFLRQEDKQGTTLYSLTYTFGFRTDPNGGCIGGGAFVRAPKCLYLWKCQWHSKPAIPYANIPDPIGESPGRVIILTSQACVETEPSRSSCLSSHLE